MLFGTVQLKIVDTLLDRIRILCFNWLGFQVIVFLLIGLKDFNKKTGNGKKKKRKGIERIPSTFQINSPYIFSKRSEAWFFKIGLVSNKPFLVVSNPSYFQILLRFSSSCWRKVAIQVSSSLSPQRRWTLLLWWVVHTMLSIPSSLSKRRVWHAVWTMWLSTLFFEGSLTRPM